MKLKKLLFKTFIAFAISLFPAVLHAQKDLEPPVITLDNPSDTICIQIGSVWTMQYTVTDNQSDKDNIVVSVNWGFNGPVNTLMRRTYPAEIEATDSNGNKSMIKVTFRVDDCIPPVINLNTPDTVCVKWRTPYYSVTPTVTDNYYSPGQVSLVKKFSDVNPNVVGIYTEIFEAVDASGNTTTKIRIVRVDPDCATVGTFDLRGIHYSVYPQPANEVLNIELDDNYLGSTLSVMSPEGRLLYQSVVGQSPETIPVGQWPAGIYILQVSNGEFSGIQKIVLQR